MNGALRADMRRPPWLSAKPAAGAGRIDTGIAEAGKRAVQVLVEEGDAEALLRHYAHATDLVVADAPGRGPFLEMLLGSTAQRLVEGMPCDVLVVRPSRGASEA